MNKKLKDLHDKIIAAFPAEVLAQLPEEERYNYEQLKVVPIELLIKADWNYKEENVAMSAKLRENLKRNGQIENIHVRLLPTGYYEVVNGNHRYDELLALGKTTVLAYDHGKCSKEEAVRKCLETNETFFEKDDIKLATLIKELTGSYSLDDLVGTMPYNEEEINNYAKLSEFNWEQFGRKEGDFEEPKPDGTKRLIIEYSSDAVGIVEEVGKLLKKFPGASIV